jgi:hypothetical protein
VCWQAKYHRSVSIPDVVEQLKEMDGTIDAVICAVALEIARFAAVVG